MGVKTILFSVILLHACTATFNESSLSSFEQTDELINDNEPSTQMSDEFNSGSPDRESVCIVQPCNGTDLNAVNSNKTTQDAYNISDESVDFLKGLLVTHVMPSFYIIIILISLPLNALALVTFTCKIREKKPAVIYMSHLACVDLLFTLLLPLKIHYR
ncbi:hypothetical protein QQF64_026124 [Cirrhinus molitorella]|uniref:G-protein coupled receptors family 1 profile domain-containing protein n=1 Tax=Cirrhinus molitorella TaxID=172907 RepID=A0ABR3NRP2_9TELE